MIEIFVETSETETPVWFLEILWLYRIQIESFYQDYWIGEKELFMKDRWLAINRIIEDT